MIATFARRIAILTAVCVSLDACQGNSSTPAAGGATTSVQVRFIEGAPSLDALINGSPQSIGTAYLSVDGATIASQFPYGLITQYVSLPAGTRSVEARATSGYFVGPLKTGALQNGKRYTIIVAGSFPHYSALTFADPASSGASLAVYEASPKVPKVEFGSFTASQHAGFRPLGPVAFGNVAAVALGKSVTNFGAYAGKGNVPLPNGALTLAQIDSFDVHNSLPFNAASQASLFVLDPSAASGGPVVGSLDR